MNKTWITDFDFYKSSNQVCSLFVTCQRMDLCNRAWRWLLDKTSKLNPSPLNSVWSCAAKSGSSGHPDAATDRALNNERCLEVIVQSTLRYFWVLFGTLLYFLVRCCTSGYVAVLLGTLKNARDARESSSPKLKRRHKMLLHGWFSFGAVSASSYFRFKNHLQSLKCCLQFQQELFPKNIPIGPLWMIVIALLLEVTYDTSAIKLC